MTALSSQENWSQVRRAGDAPIARPSPDLRSAVVDRVDDLASVDALQVDRRDPEVGMP
jgi:hypothetical protein